MTPEENDLICRVEGMHRRDGSCDAIGLRHARPRRSKRIELRACWGKSMGPISDRGKERVGVGDLPVSALRRLLAETAPAVGDGKPAIATTGPRIPRASIGSFEGIVPKSSAWRSLGGGSDQPSARNLQCAIVSR